MYKKLWAVALLSICLGGLTLPQANASALSSAMDKAIATIQTNREDPLKEKLEQISLRFENRLEILDNNMQNGALSEEDVQIIELLDETFPSLLKELTKTDDMQAIGNKLQQASAQLAELLLNDPDFDHSEDTMQIATSLAQTLGVMYVMSNMDAEEGEELFNKMFEYLQKTGSF